MTEPTMPLEPAAPAAPTPEPVATVEHVPDTRERQAGPAPFAVALGVACLAVAGLALAADLGGTRFDLGAYGPVFAVGAGAVLIVLGLLGLRREHR